MAFSAAILNYVTLSNHWDLNSVNGSYATPLKVW